MPDANTIITGPRQVALSPRAHVLERKPELAAPVALEGARLGFFWNSKPNGDVLLDELALRIREQLTLRDTVRVAKSLPTSGAPAEVIEEIVHRCDAVVFASAD